MYYLLHLLMKIDFFNIFSMTMFFVVLFYFVNCDQTNCSESNVEKVHIDVVTIVSYIQKTDLFEENQTTGICKELNKNLFLLDECNDDTWKYFKFENLLRFCCYLSQLY
jgi:hypothetical protein